MVRTSWAAASRCRRTTTRSRRSAGTIAPAPSRVGTARRGGSSWTGSTAAARPRSAAIRRSPAYPATTTRTAPRTGPDMPERHRVRCVTTGEGADPEERIVRIGGINTVGVNWRLTQDEAIAGIEGGRWDFFVVQRQGRALDVVVAKAP